MHFAVLGKTALGHILLSVDPKLLRAASVRVPPVWGSLQVRECQCVDPPPRGGANKGTNDLSSMKLRPQLKHITTGRTRKQLRCGQ